MKEIFLLFKEADVGIPLWDHETQDERWIALFFNLYIRNNGYLYLDLIESKKSISNEYFIISYNNQLILFEFTEEAHEELKNNHYEINCNSFRKYIFDWNRFIFSDLYISNKNYINIIWAIIVLLNDSISGNKYKIDSKNTKIRFDYAINRCSHYMFLEPSYIKETLNRFINEDYENIINDFLYSNKILHDEDIQKLVNHIKSIDNTEKQLLILNLKRLQLH